MNKKEKQCLVEELENISLVFDMTDDELKQRHPFLNKYEDIELSVRCGIVQAEIDHLIEKVRKGN